jgi:peptidoglycan hydrolase-like protein with peptidoglycan-binding domain
MSPVRPSRHFSTCHAFCFCCFIFASANNPAHAARKASPALTLQAANDAHWSSGATSGPVLLKAQVVLDPAGFSPGAIDPREGANFEKTLRAFQQAHRLDATGTFDQVTWERLANRAQSQDQIPTARRLPPPSTTHREAAPYPTCIRRNRRRAVCLLFTDGTIR